MAEALTTPQRTPEANLPISMRGKAADMLKPVEVKVPTLTEIIAGSETMIGGMEIPTQTIELHETEIKLLKTLYCKE